MWLSNRRLEEFRKDTSKALDSKKILDAFKASLNDYNELSRILRSLLLLKSARRSGANNMELSRSRVMKWEKGLLVSIGFVVGGLSYGSLPEIVNLGPSSDLAEAFLPALKIKSIFMPKVEPYYIETTYHGYFPSESEGEGLQVQCSTSDTTGYNFNGCDLSKAA
jgi:hypothetical protein